LFNRAARTSKRKNSKTVFVQQLKMPNEPPGQPRRPNLQSDFNVSLLTGFGKVGRRYKDLLRIHDKALRVERRSFTLGHRTWVESAAAITQSL
jgi:hypothetical protein